MAPVRSRGPFIRCRVSTAVVRCRDGSGAGHGWPGEAFLRMTDPPSRCVTQGGSKSLGRIPGAAQSSAATGTPPRRFRRARWPFNCRHGRGRPQPDEPVQACHGRPAQSPAPAPLAQTRPTLFPRPVRTAQPLPAPRPAARHHTEVRQHLHGVTAEGSAAILAQQTAKAGCKPTGFPARLPIGSPRPRAGRLGAAGCLGHVRKEPAPGRVARGESTPGAPSPPRRWPPCCFHHRTGPAAGQCPKGRPWSFRPAGRVGTGCSPVGPNSFTCS